MDMHLIDNLYAKDIAQKPTRDGFGDALVELGKKDKRVVVFCADLTESTRVLAFKNAFPERFIQLGVSEQSMASLASGMALAGKIPFIASYAMFSPGRNWEQLRTCAGLQNMPVKIAGAHAGVSVGPDGATHQAIEDIAITRVIPNMTVVVPCDTEETRKATVACVDINGPVYLRFARDKSPMFTTKETPFEIGKANVLREGTDVALIACGPLVYQALLAAEMLKKKRISARVINCHTIKPLDEKTLTAAARECGAVVAIEEHQRIGGLGGALSELFAKQSPVPMEFIGVDDRYGESGEPDDLLAFFKLTAPHIATAAQKVLKRK
jgi:transketolase